MSLLKFIYSKIKKSFIFKLLNTILLIFSNKYILLNFHEDYRNYNFGDRLNYYICKELFNKKPVPYWNAYNILNKPVYSFVGSVLDNYKETQLIIWGSGYMNINSNPLSKPIINALRGPLTGGKLDIKHTVYGDLALLLPLIYTKKVSKIYKLGLIPHFLDYGMVKSKYTNYLQDPNIKLIDFNTKNIKKTLELILSCEQIVSSSLHGLIISDAFNIPNFWVTFSDEIKGGGEYKFIDYYLSINKKINKPINIDSIKEINAINFESYVSVKYNPINLIKVSPIKIVNKNIIDFINLNS